MKMFIYFVFFITIFLIIIIEINKRNHSKNLVENNKETTCKEVPEYSKNKKLNTYSYPCPENKRGVLNIEFFVTGTHYKAMRVDKERQTIIHQMKVHETVTIEKEPDNPYDPRAIVVLNEKGEDLGYIRKIDQFKLLPYLDANRFIIAAHIYRFYTNEYGKNVIIRVSIGEILK